MLTTIIRATRRPWILVDGLLPISALQTPTQLGFTCRMRPYSRFLANHCGSSLRTLLGTYINCYVRAEVCADIIRVYGPYRCFILIPACMKQAESHFDSTNQLHMSGSEITTSIMSLDIALLSSKQIPAGLLAAFKSPHDSYKFTPPTSPIHLRPLLPLPLRLTKPKHQRSDPQ